MRAELIANVIKGNIIPDVSESYLSGAYPFPLGDNSEHPVLVGLEENLWCVCLPPEIIKYNGKYYEKIKDYKYKKLG